MKKIIVLLSVLTISLVVVACGNSAKKAETDTFISNENGAKMEVAFTHEGDKLKKVSQKMEYALSYFGIDEKKKLDEKTKKELEKNVATQFNEFKKGAKGLSLTTEFTKSSMVLKTTIDLNKIDSKTASSIIGGSSNSKNISYKDTVKEFEDRGFKKKD